MNMSNLIMENIANPHELERIFRAEPEAFKKSFLQVWKQNPDSQVLAVWYERLYFQETENREKTSSLQKSFCAMGIFAVLAGISTRLILHFVEMQVIAPANLVFGIIPFIAAYFVYNNTPKRKVLYALVAALGEAKGRLTVLFVCLLESKLLSDKSKCNPGLP